MSASNGSALKDLKEPINGKEHSVLSTGLGVCAKCTMERALVNGICAMCEKRADPTPNFSSGPGLEKQSDANVAEALDAARQVEESGVKAEIPDPSTTLRAKLVIDLYMDGNMSINGPFNDRITYHGMLAVAGDCERERFFAQNAADNVARHKKGPGFLARVLARSKQL